MLFKIRKYFSLRKNIIFLFLVSFIIFNFNLNSIGAGDTVPARFLPFNIFSGKGLYFDDLVNPLQNIFTTTYYFRFSNGHYVSSYPIFTGLIVSPIYLPTYLYLRFNNAGTWNDFYLYSFLLEKLSASFLASISVVLFYILMNKISKNTKLNMLFALTFAFGSQTFSVSSQALWQHGTANLFVILSQIFLVKALIQKQDKNAFDYILSLIFATLTFWSRPNFFLYLLLLFVLICFQNKKRFFTYLSVLMISLFPLIFYNLYFFNSLFGGYGVHTRIFVISTFFSSLSGLLFSPGRGVMFYTPFFIFSFLAIFLYKKISKTSKTLKLIYILNILYLFLGLFLNSIWGGWWGGHSYGDRLLTDIAVSAVLLSYLFYIHVKNYILRTIFTVLVIYSIFAQTVGVCCFMQSHWNSVPNNVDFNPDRLWDFKDNPIIRSIQAGPIPRGTLIIQKTLIILNIFNPF